MENNINGNLRDKQKPIKTHSKVIIARRLVYIPSRPCIGKKLYNLVSIMNKLYSSTRNVTFNYINGIIQKSYMKYIDFILYKHLRDITRGKHMVKLKYVSKGDFIL